MDDDDDAVNDVEASNEGAAFIHASTVSDEGITLLPLGLLLHGRHPTAAWLQGDGIEREEVPPCSARDDATRRSFPEGCPRVPPPEPPTKEAARSCLAAESPLVDDDGFGNELTLLSDIVGLLPMLEQTDVDCCRLSQSAVTLGLP